MGHCFLSLESIIQPDGKLEQGGPVLKMWSLSRECWIQLFEKHTEVKMTPNTEHSVAKNTTGIKNALALYYVDVGRTTRIQNGIFVFSLAYC